MTDLSENAPFDEVLEGSNTDIAEQLSDADIDAINEVLAEAESTLAENTTVEPSGNSEQLDEPVGNNDRLESESGTVAENETENHIFYADSIRHPGYVVENTTTEQVGNSEQLEPEIPEPEPYVCPWADAPKNVIFYEKMYEDGHLGGSTESAEMAYKFGWYENRISKDDVQLSDVNGFIYRKEVCPMKSERDKQIELWSREIFELKEELSQTDYKAIKYAEGVMTDDEYQPVGIQRQAWRHRINELEELIKG